MASYFTFLQDFDELQFIYIASKVIMVTSAFVAICLVFLKAEYGRYFTGNSWQNVGFSVNPRVAWFVQELPAFVTPWLVLCYAHKDFFGFTPNAILLSLYLLHYTHR